MPSPDPLSAAPAAGEWTDELGVALRAAAAAAEVIASYYLDSALAVERKADNSPVTAADREAEGAIREVLREAFPNDGLYGEELGRDGDGARRTWLVDPLDGTKSFVRGTPFFSTQIALWQDGRAVLGVSHAPVFGETVWAAEGAGAWLDGRRLAVSGRRRLSDACLLVGNPATLAADARAWSAFGKLVGECDRVRGYGDFYQFHALARGAADVVLDTGLTVLDLAAVSVIVREAGGVFTDLEGAPLGLASRSVLAAASAPLHEQVHARLNGR